MNLKNEILHNFILCQVIDCCLQRFSFFPYVSDTRYEHVIFSCFMHENFQNNTKCKKILLIMLQNFLHLLSHDNSTSRICSHEGENVFGSSTSMLSFPCWAVVCCLFFFSFYNNFFLQFQGVDNSLLK